MEKIDGNARYCGCYPLRYGVTLLVTRYVTPVTDRLLPELRQEIGNKAIVPAAKKEAAIALELEQKMPNPFKWAKEKSWKL